ncbi:MFS transporter [Streptomyces sp. SJL17-1]|uniref:MFS transporter n=1 Tax=Streptomyces sp. SJL17-1 TaxID=2967223 RepID=UPI002966504E|nr:MFS transporter [Streptomyces sp. SJL17-1]
MTPLARLLIKSQFAFNLGFFAVLPYLAGHLGGALGFGGALVGLVLGLRSFSQQGLFVVGGALTDRYGPRPVVLAGCALRVVGFAWLALAENPWTVTGAVVLVGFAAALFSPAVESEIAREALRAERSGGPRRTRTLARFSAGGQAGALLGPALGALLLYGTGDAHFRTACLAGAAVFALVLAAHARLMPRGGGRERHPGEWRTVLGERRFLRLALAYSTYLLAYNQLYLALPAELDRATGSQAALGWLFALSSALVVFGSAPLERLAATRLDGPAMVRAGLLLIAAAFAATAALRTYEGLWAAATFTVLLTLGQMLVLPATRALLPDLVDERRLGLATGALSSLSGLVVLAASAPVGALLDHPGPAPWLLLATTPLLGLAFVPAARGPLAPGAKAPRRANGPQGVS